MDQRWLYLFWLAVACLIAATVLLADVIDHVSAPQPTLGFDDPTTAPTSIPHRSLIPLDMNDTADACGLVLSARARLRDDAYTIAAQCDGRNSRIQFLRLATVDPKVTEHLLVLENVQVDFRKHSIWPGSSGNGGIPRYAKGFVAADCRDQGLLDLGTGHSNSNHVESLLGTGLALGQMDCMERETVQTLFLTREGTAGSVYHNIAEVFGAYLALLAAGITTTDVQVVVLDGHATPELKGQGPGNMAPLIQVLSNRQVLGYRNFTGRSVCFDRAIWPIPGWSTYLWPYVWNPPLEPCQSKSSSLYNFRQLALDGLGVALDAPRGSVPRILLVERRTTRIIENQGEFLALLRAQNATVTTIDFRFDQTLKSQIEAVRAADIIIGAHGAGLTNTMFARPGTVVIEILDAEHERSQYFSRLSVFCGLVYHRHYVPHRGVAPYVDLDAFQVQLAIVYKTIGF